MYKKITAIGSLVTGAILPLLASAQTVVNGLPTAQPRQSIDVYAFITTLFNYALGILIFIAGIMVLYAGFLYVMGGQDEKKVEKAQSMIRYAAIAVIIGILSKALIVVIENIARG